MLRSQDYHAHISKVQRTPTVLTDVPRYPNAHMAFNKRVVYEEEDEIEEGSRHQQHHHHGHHNPEVRERVEVVEYERVPEVGVGEVIYEENVDVESDPYCPRRNRGGLELHKWKTYRP